MPAHLDLEVGLAVAVDVAFEDGAATGIFEAECSGIPRGNGIKPDQLKCVVDAGGVDVGVDDREVNQSGALIKIGDYVAVGSPHAAMQRAGKFEAIETNASSH